MTPKPRRWYTDTPCIPLASDMRLLRRKPARHLKHVPVLVVPLSPSGVDAMVATLMTIYIKNLQCGPRGPVAELMRASAREHLAALGIR